MRSSAMCRKGYASRKGVHT